MNIENTDVLLYCIGTIGYRPHLQEQERNFFNLLLTNFQIYYTSKYACIACESRKEAPQPQRKPLGVLGAWGLANNRKGIAIGLKGENRDRVGAFALPFVSNPRVS